mmetsp:Transcript_29201/g.45755  ORF Transcript_29201/g.45755 Transcript_29201/m.45755 type:complete len:157 (-) Transcript_29201:661-1131(-)
MEAQTENAARPVWPCLNAEDYLSVFCHAMRMRSVASDPTPVWGLPMHNQRHKRHVPPETRSLQNLLTQCRKDNKRFFHKRMAIRHGDLRDRLMARAECAALSRESDAKQNFIDLCKGRLVPLSVQDPELTASNCVVLDRAQPGLNIRPEYSRPQPG